MFLSIMGMYEYDQSVFNGLSIPDGIDKDAVIAEICLQCGELEIMYPNIDTMKLAITVWSLSNQHTWDKLYKTMNLDYNPIWNVDADVHQITTDSGDDSRTRSGSTNRDIDRKNTKNLTDKDTVALADTKSVKGFNSNTWAEAEKVDKSGTDTITHTGTDNETVSDDAVISETEKGTNKNTREYTERRSGNIGVTTTQKMIQEERDIAQFSIINYIALSFKERFCILVY